jgi:predicted signal transduction protein with EAL and GGDEF domain
MELRDITARRRAESLRNQASRDPLTNCLNHAAIGAKLTRATRGARVAVVMADIDGMKAINDTYGHPVGDAALTAVARALCAAARWSDAMAATSSSPLPDALRPKPNAIARSCWKPRGGNRARCGVGVGDPVAASMGVAVFLMRGHHRRRHPPRG